MKTLQAYHQLSSGAEIKWVVVNLQFIMLMQAETWMVKIAYIAPICP